MNDDTSDYTPGTWPWWDDYIGEDSPLVRLLEEWGELPAAGSHPDSQYGRAVIAEFARVAALVQEAGLMPAPEAAAPEPPTRFESESRQAAAEAQRVELDVELLRIRVEEARRTQQTGQPELSPLQTVVAAYAVVSPSTGQAPPLSWASTTTSTTAGTSPDSAGLYSRAEMVDIIQVCLEVLGTDA